MSIQTGQNNNLKPLKNRLGSAGHWAEPMYDKVQEVRSEYIFCELILTHTLLDAHTTQWGL